MNKEMKKRFFQRISAVALLAAASALIAPAAWAGPNGASQGSRDEFFIISSVNLSKHHLVLKQPSEVTVVMNVNDKTVIIGEKGEHMNVHELRAGDTVYISYRKNAQGLTAERIRLGPMTVQELHRRYLKGYAVPVPPPPPAESAPPKKKTQPKAVPHSQPTKLQRGR